MGRPRASYAARASFDRCIDALSMRMMELARQLRSLESSYCESSVMKSKKVNVVFLPWLIEKKVDPWLVIAAIIEILGNLKELEVNILLPCAAHPRYL